jgi:hypothetical protein
VAGRAGFALVEEFQATLQPLLQLLMEYILHRCVASFFCTRRATAIMFLSMASLLLPPSVLSSPLLVDFPARYSNSALLGICIGFVGKFFSL